MVGFSVSFTVMSPVSRISFRVPTWAAVRPRSRRKASALALRLRSGDLYEERKSYSWIMLPAIPDAV